MTDKKIPKDTYNKDQLIDKSAYGEFVSTFHHWTGLEETHKRGIELTNNTANTSDMAKTPYRHNTKEE